MFNVLTARSLHHNSPHRTLANFGVDNKKSILDAVDEHGALLLTDFDRSHHPLNFAAFCKALALRPYDLKQTAAPRTEIAPNVFTANEAPSDATISFHHELAQTRSPPDYIFFWAQHVAAAGGATPIVRSRDVAQYVQLKYPSACAELHERGIRYCRTLPMHTDPTSAIGRGWLECYGPSRALAEKSMHREGIEWQWLPNDELMTFTSCMPFFGTHNNHTTFFNSAVTARRTWRDARNEPSRAVVFGDKDALTHEVDDLLRDAEAFMHHNAWRGAWSKPGDVLLLDNRQVLHARDPFEGRRRVLTSLWSTNSKS